MSRMRKIGFGKLPEAITQRNINVFDFKIREDAITGSMNKLKLVTKLDSTANLGARYNRHAAAPGDWGIRVSRSISTSIGSLSEDDEATTSYIFIGGPSALDPAIYKPATPFVPAGADFEISYSVKNDSFNNDELTDILLSTYLPKITNGGLMGSLSSSLPFIWDITSVSADRSTFTISVKAVRSDGTYDYITNQVVSCAGKLPDSGVLAHCKLSRINGRYSIDFGKGPITLPSVVPGSVDGPITYPCFYFETAALYDRNGDYLIRDINFLVKNAGGSVVKHLAFAKWSELDIGHDVINDTYTSGWLNDEYPPRMGFPYPYSALGSVPSTYSGQNTILDGNLLPKSSILINTGYNARLAFNAGRGVSAAIQDKSFELSSDTLSVSDKGSSKWLFMTMSQDRKFNNNKDYVGLLLKGDVSATAVSNSNVANVFPVTLYAYRSGVNQYKKVTVNLPRFFVGEYIKFSLIGDSVSNKVSAYYSEPLTGNNVLLATIDFSVDFPLDTSHYDITSDVISTFYGTELKPSATGPALAAPPNSMSDPMIIHDYVLRIDGTYVFRYAHAVSGFIDTVNYAHAEDLGNYLGALATADKVYDNYNPLEGTFSRSTGSGWKTYSSDRNIALLCDYDKMLHSVVCDNYTDAVLADMDPDYADHKNHSYKIEMAFCITGKGPVPPGTTTDPAWRRALEYRLTPEGTSSMSNSTGYKSLVIDVLPENALGFSPLKIGVITSTGVGNMSTPISVDISPTSFSSAGVKKNVFYLLEIKIDPIPSTLTSIVKYSLRKSKKVFARFSGDWRNAYSSDIVESFVSAPVVTDISTIRYFPAKNPLKIGGKGVMINRIRVSRDELTVLDFYPDSSVKYPKNIHPTTNAVNGMYYSEVASVLPISPYADNSDYYSTGTLGALKVGFVIEADADPSAYGYQDMISFGRATSKAEISYSVWYLLGSTTNGGPMDPLFMDFSSHVTSGGGYPVSPGKPREIFRIKKKLSAGRLVNMFINESGNEIPLTDTAWVGNSTGIAFGKYTGDLTVICDLKVEDLTAGSHDTLVKIEADMVFGDFSGKTIPYYPQDTVIIADTADIDPSKHYRYIEFGPRYTMPIRLRSPGVTPGALSPLGSVFSGNYGVRLDLMPYPSEYPTEVLNSYQKILGIGRDVSIGLTHDLQLVVLGYVTDIVLTAGHRYDIVLNRSDISQSPSITEPELFSDTIYAYVTDKDDSMAPMQYRTVSESDSLLYAGAGTTGWFNASTRTNYLTFRDQPPAALGSDMFEYSLGGAPVYGPTTEAYRFNGRLISARLYLGEIT